MERSCGSKILTGMLEKQRYSIDLQSKLANRNLHSYLAHY